MPINRQCHQLPIGDRPKGSSQSKQQSGFVWLAALLLVLLAAGCGQQGKPWEVQVFVTNASDDQSVYIVRGTPEIDTDELALTKGTYWGIAPGATEMIPFGGWFDGEDPGCMGVSEQLWLIESPSGTRAVRTQEGGSPRHLIESVPDAQIWFHIGPGECFDTRNQDIEYPSKG